MTNYLCLFLECKVQNKSLPLQQTVTAKLVVSCFILMCSRLGLTIHYGVPRTVRPDNSHRDYFQPEKYPPDHSSP